MNGWALDVDKSGGLMEFKDCTFEYLCKKCDTPMKPGPAGRLAKEYQLSGDKPEGSEVVCSYRCSACGWSVW